MSLPDKNISEQALDKLQQATIDLFVSVYHVRQTKDDSLREGWKANAKIAIETIKKAAQMI